MKYGWLFLPLAAFASTASAGTSQQMPAADEEPDVCIGAYIWNARSDEATRLAEAPVPPSFRAVMERPSCYRGDQSSARMIDLHFAFGDERSVAAALAYLEQRQALERPVLDAFEQEFSGAWSAFRAANAAGALPHNAPPARRVYDLLSVGGGYLSLAQQYLRAAETYGSAAFLRKAETYFAPFDASVTLMCGRRDPSRPACPSAPRYFNLHSMLFVEMDNLDLGLAVMRARISRSPADIDAANERVAFYGAPVFASGGDQQDYGCNHFLPPEAVRTPLQQACEQDDDFEDRALGYWRYRAHLDLLMGGDPAHYASLSMDRPYLSAQFVRRQRGSLARDGVQVPESVGLAARLMRGIPQSLPADHYWVEPRAHALTLLLLESAELHERIARELPANTRLFGEAADLLMEAERLSPPHVAPQRFRRVAQQYLKLWEDFDGQVQADRRAPVYARFAAHLRQSLASLDAVTRAARQPTG